MTVNRYPLPRGRELRATRTSRELVVIAVHDVAGGGGRCCSGPLAMPADELDTLRSALADLAGETGGREAAE